MFESILTHLANVPGPPDNRGFVLYVALRERGRLLHESLEPVRSKWDEAFKNWLRRGADAEAGSRADVAEVCLGHTVQLQDQGGGGLANVHRGVRGLAVTVAGRTHVLAPTQMIAGNLSFERALALIAARERVPALPPDAVVRTFEASQYLYALRPSFSATALFRGKPIVRIDAVTPARVLAAAEGMGTWLAARVAPGGEMPYKYWPSRGESSTANNVIRQFMATVALGRWASFKRSDALHGIAERNLRRNLERWFRHEGELGVIEHDGAVKLGAVALAALAIQESSARETLRTEEEALARAIDHLWRADGSFLTFLKPPGRNDNQNFYPGEALLYWATLLRERRPLDKRLHSRFRASFEYYRAWHRAQRNPAFVPWHTQAYFAVWRLTGERDMQEFIFETNDWLLGMQEWERSPYPDLRGRFYDSRRPHLGPPHASSTGVYLEGLADAWRLARTLSDRERQASYRTAVKRGLRSVMQLQFSGDGDMFYVAKPHLVRGAVRTTEYDNTIRIDNVQHNLMAILKLLDLLEEDGH